MRVGGGDGHCAEDAQEDSSCILTSPLFLLVLVGVGASEADGDKESCIILPWPLSLLRLPFVIAAFDNVIRCVDVLVDAVRSSTGIGSLVLLVDATRSEASRDSPAAGECAAAAGNVIVLVILCPFRLKA